MPEFVKGEKVDLNKNLSKLSMKKIGSSSSSFYGCEDSLNSAIEIRMSDKSKRALKIADKFDEQIKENREYLDGFSNKVEQIYEKETYRNYLNGKWYERTIKELESKKKNMFVKIERTKDENIKDLKGAMEENCWLEKLKKSFEKILEKEENKLEKEKKEYKDIGEKNGEKKEKIKSFWRHTQANERVNDPEGVIIGKNKNYNASINKIRVETESIYITSKDSSHTDLFPISKHSIICLDSDNKNKLDKLRKKRKLSQDFLDNGNISSFHVYSNKLEKIGNKKGSETLKNYEEAIKKIEDLENSIMRSKIPKKKSLEKIGLDEEKVRKLRIKEKIECAEYKREMIRLLLSYLKSKEALSVETGLGNIHKVIFYLERNLENKQSVLANVQQVMETIHFL